MVSVLRLEIHVFFDYKGKFVEAAETMFEIMVGMLAVQSEETVSMVPLIG